MELGTGVAVWVIGSFTISSVSPDSSFSSSSSSSFSSSDDSDSPASVALFVYSTIAGAVAVLELYIMFLAISSTFLENFGFTSAVPV